MSSVAGQKESAPETPDYTASPRCRRCGIAPSDPRVRPKLGMRERETLRAWLRFDSKQRVAQELFVSANTVKKHVERIRAKYAAVGRPANTKTALLIRAIEDGLIRLDDLR